MGGDDGRRVRALLDAVIGLGEGLELTEVLQRIVTAACEVTGARYGALGVQDGDGDVVEFFSHGIGPDDRALIGDHPQGRGLPGLLLTDDAEPLRLSNLSDHARFTGFPEHHPPMRAFLGVPIRVSGATFGNLYVADPRTPADGGRPASPDGSGPAFVPDDEDSLRALASAAGVAIGNARLYAAARRRQTWWEAASEAVQAVVDPDTTDPGDALHAVARVAGRAAAADVAAVYLRAGDGLDRTAVWPDDAADVPARIDLPDGTDWLDDVPWCPGPACQVLLPLAVGRRDLGAVGLGWRHGRPPGAEDVLLMRTFAERVALALEASRAAADRAALALLQDRDRIARDLHDLVIQRLFAVGLSLQAAGNVARVPEVARRLARAVDDLDDTIKDVRRTIFQLHGTAVRSPLRDELEEIVATTREDLAVPVRLVVEGPILALPEELEPDVLAVAREALANVAKHADAAKVQVLLRIGRAVELEITDDGVGLADGGRRSGLANLEARAATHGGTLRVRSGPDGGTSLTWTVPRR